MIIVGTHKVRFPKDQSPNQLFVVWERIGCGAEKAYVTEYQIQYCSSLNGNYCSGILYNI